MLQYVQAYCSTYVKSKKKTFTIEKTLKWIIQVY